MTPNPKISPEREAELNRWAAEFRGWEGVRVMQMQGWPEPLAVCFKDGEMVAALFTRSLDAAREISEAMKHESLYKHQDFILSFKSKLPGGKIDPEPGHHAVFMQGVSAYMEATALEICLNAYLIVTGTAFDLGVSGAAEGGETL